MDLLTLFGILLRRWYVVVPTLLLTVFAAYMVDTRTPAEYEAVGWVLIETPNLDQTTSAPADVLALADELADDPPDGLPRGAEFVVQAGDTPVSFEVSAAADTPEGAEGAVTGVTAALQERLAESQSTTDESARVELRQTLPRAIPEQQPDGSFTASMPLELRDPTIGVANPYGANPGTGRLLQVAIMGDSGQARFSEQFDADIQYSVDQASRDTAALLQITTTGANEGEVIAAFFTLQEVLDADLDERQARAGVPPSRRVRVAAFDAPLRATDVSPPVERATAAVLLLGGLLSIGLGVGANALAQKRASTAASAPSSSFAASKRPGRKKVASRAGPKGNGRVTTNHGAKAKAGTRTR